MSENKDCERKECNRMPYMYPMGYYPTYSYPMWDMGNMGRCPMCGAPMNTGYMMGMGNPYMNYNMCTPFPESDDRS